MSKGSLFWGNASGKLGESVFYRAGGTQRNRTYIAHPSNPKTEKQMRNRITMSNLTAMYRGLKSILSYSFTNRDANLSGFNAFVSANKPRLPYAIAKDMLEDCAYVSLGMRVAQGDIVCNISPKQIPYVLTTEKSAPPRYTYQLFSGANVALDEVPSETDFGALTGGLIYKVLTANGNPSQLPTRFKVTLLWGSVDIHAMSGAEAQGSTPMCYRVYDCYDASTDMGEYHGAADWAEDCSLRGLFTSSDSISGSNNISGVLDGFSVGSAMTAEEGQSDVFALVVSYSSTDGLHCNNAFVYGGEGAATAATDYLPGGFVYDQILAESGYTADNALASSVAVQSVDLTGFVAPLVEESLDDEEEIV